MHHAVGLIELSSIAKGVEVTDLMVKSANVEILATKTICPGKYITMVGGEIGAVQQSVANAQNHAGHLAIDQFVLPNIHASVLPAISGATEVKQKQSIGVVETFSVAACIVAADQAVKAANVELLRLHMAFGIGGKCYMVLNGDVADITAAVQVASQSAGDKGLLVNNSVIARPAPALWQHLL